MTPTTVSDVLNLAADYIDEHGWTTGAYMRPNGCVCMVGALRMAIGGTVLPIEDDDGVLHVEVDVSSDLAGLYCDARYALNVNLGDGDGLRDLAWNDEPGRTADEVATKLREVAAAERAS